MAGVERFESRQLFGVGLDQVGELEQDAATVGASQSRPRGKSPARRFDRAIDIGRACKRDIGDGRVVMRIERGQRLARESIDEASADEKLVPDRSLEADGVLKIREVHRTTTGVKT